MVVGISKVRSSSHLQRNQFSKHIIKSRIPGSFEKPLKLDNYDRGGDMHEDIEHIDIMLDYHHIMIVV